MMTIRELIEELEEIANEIGDDEIEVRLMTQEHYPLEAEIHGVVDCETLVDDNGNDSEEETPIVYITEGRNIGYGMKSAWGV